MCVSPLLRNVLYHYSRSGNPTAQSYTNQRAQECGSSSHNTDDKACAGLKKIGGVTSHVCMCDFDAGSCRERGKNEVCQD